MRGYKHLIIIFLIILFSLFIVNFVLANVSSPTFSVPLPAKEVKEEEPPADEHKVVSYNVVEEPKRDLLWGSIKKFGGWSWGLIKRFKLEVILGGGILVIIFLLSNILIKLKRALFVSVHKKLQLRKFCRKKLAEGYTKEQIVNMFKHEGWSNSQIDLLLKDILRISFLGEKFRKTMVLKQFLSFKYRGESYDLYLDSIKTNLVYLSIYIGDYNKIARLQIRLNETKEVDINKDGINDFAVNLRRISEDSARFSFIGFPFLSKK